MDRNYVAFISYRHAEMDSAIAKTIHSLIEQYRIPKGLRKDSNNRLGLVFRDEEELHAASDLSAEIQNALENTEYLIVICSKNSIESPWVGREIDYFLKNHDRSKILAVLASGEPNEVFPSQLTLTPEGELIEPLAMDVRAETISGNKKKVRKELPRLISAMLDCPYDALVMREQKRKTNDQYVFPSPNGGPISPDSVNNMLKRVLERADIPKVRFHDLRHTFATIALQNGVDIKTVSGMLGHFSAGFTLDTYAHVTTAAQKEAAQTMGNILGG